VFSADLSWTIPATRENGQALALSELAGYEIYYVVDGVSVTDRTIAVSGGGVVGYRISDLPAGSYSFAVTAIDSAGAKSALSSVVAINVGQ
jgi:predicted enzyme related to lactoylglutathione lyase